MTLTLEHLLLIPSLLLVVGDSIWNQKWKNVSDVVGTVVRQVIRLRKWDSAVRGEEVAKKRRKHKSVSTEYPHHDVHLIYLLQSPSTQRRLPRTNGSVSSRRATLAEGRMSNLIGYMQVGIICTKSIFTISPAANWASVIENRDSPPALFMTQSWNWQRQWEPPRNWLDMQHSAPVNLCVCVFNRKNETWKRANLWSLWFNLFLLVCLVGRIHLTVKIHLYVLSQYCQSWE